MNNDLWEWLDDFARRMALSGHPERRRLMYGYYQAMHLLESDPDQALSYLENEIAMARRVDEPCWQLYCEYWRCEGYVFYKRDLKTGLDYAVRLVVDAVKPIYRNCNRSIITGAFRILLDAYVLSDPIGYADKITEMIAYIERELPLDHDNAFLVRSRRVILDLVFERYAAAEQGALGLLEYCDTMEDFEFHRASAYEMLCMLAYRTGKLDQLNTWAALGEASARRSSRLSSAATFLAWQAVSLCDRGDDTAAALYQRAFNQMQHLGMTASSGTYEALSAYHLVRGDVEQALALREQEAEALAGKGHMQGEAECWLARCRLRKRLGRLDTDTLQQARDFATSLRAPERYRAALEQIVENPA